MRLKWKILLGLLIVVGLAVGYDYLRMRSFDVAVVDISPDPAPADGTSPVAITVKVTRDDQPIEGHDIYALTKNGGNFKAYRVKTNAVGEAVFTYFPYQSSSYTPAGDVEMYFRDESNSVFIEIYASTTCVLHLEEPTEELTPALTMDDIFG